MPVTIFVHKIENFELKRGIVELLQYLTTQNYKLFVVTNQSGIGRGYFTETDFLRLTEYMITIFKEYGVSFEEVYHCSCAPEKDCECRKPSPHMINKGVDKYEIDVSMSWLIGDKESDIGAANNAGIYNTIKVLGKVLLNEFMVPFEFASVLLLVAMIGAVLLSKKENSAK